MVQVFIGLGSNLGDRACHLRQALTALRTLSMDGQLQVSRFRLTAPVGGPPQPPFLNAVASLCTALTPRALLAALHRIEAAHGRERLIHHGPRTLDLDLLWYGGHQVHDAGLQVPHPRLHERRFVLEPLAELAPQLPVGEVTVHQRLQCLAPASSS